jgi:hypothetical protein
MSNKIDGDSWSPAPADNRLCCYEDQDGRLRAGYGTTRRFSGPVEDGAEIAWDTAD